MLIKLQLVVDDIKGKTIRQLKERLRALTIVKTNETLRSQIEERVLMYELAHILNSKSKSDLMICVLEEFKNNEKTNRASDRAMRS